MHTSNQQKYTRPNNNNTDGQLTTIKSKPITIDTANQSYKQAYQQKHTRQTNKNAQPNNINTQVQATIIHTSNQQYRQLTNNTHDQRKQLFSANQQQYTRQTKKNYTLKTNKNKQAYKQRYTDQPTIDTVSKQQWTQLTDNNTHGQPTATRTVNEQQNS